MDDQTQRLYEMKAEVIKAVAHPIRLAIIDRLREGEVCVCHLAEQVGAERSNVSRHLALMVKAGVLTSRKEGLMVFYRLRTPCIVDFFACVERALRQNLREDAAALTRL
jgi:DNA-binding transcriptional ArsR family regulator